jgi:hypothetical protein
MNLSRVDLESWSAFLAVAAAGRPRPLPVTLRKFCAAAQACCAADADSRGALDSSLLPALAGQHHV